MGYDINVRVKLESEQLGTIPKSEKVFSDYLKHRAKGKEGKDEFKSPLTGEEVDDREARAWTGFMEEDDKTYVMDYMIKGFLKHAGNVLKKELGIKNLRSKIDDLVFVTPRKIFFDGKKGSDPIERSIRVMTPQGPRVSLIRSDYMEIGAKLEFKITVPIDCEIKKKHVLRILEHGAFMGLGQFRNGGYGRFSYEIVK